MFSAWVPSFLTLRVAVTWEPGGVLRLIGRGEVVRRRSPAGAWAETGRRQEKKKNTTRITGRMFFEFVLFVLFVIFVIFV
jgi:hypothetical protein